MSMLAIVNQFVDSNEVLTTLVSVVVTAGAGFMGRAVFKQGGQRKSKRHYARPYIRSDGTRVRGHYRVSNSYTRERSHGLRWAPRAVIGPMARAAALLLPVDDRPRYVEEYQSELWSLSESGAGCIAQLRYVVRLILCAVPLGLALRRPRRRSAAL
jgi:hypothetical protein